MRQHEALAILTNHQNTLKDFGVKSLILFDSVARDEARIDSDVNLLVEFDRPVPFRSLNMDITATLNEIASLNIEDRILLVQAIWDSIAAEQAYPDLTEVQKRELDYRIDDYEMNPDNVLTWEEIKASIKGQ